MLNHVHIRHFAIIDKTDLELSAGMTALTGETGAGKSILLDALGQVLGGRSSADFIAQGHDRADITASFDLDALPRTKQWLIENDLDDDDQCILRRVLARSGKNRSSINGRPVSNQIQRELGEQLLVIHGQNEHQQLAKASAQRELLDAFSKSPLSAQVGDAFDAWQEAKNHLQSLMASGEERQNRIDLLQFQLQEFDSVDIGGSTINDIEDEHRRMANADRIQQLCDNAIHSLDADGTAVSQLGASIPVLTELVGIDERMREALDLIESAHIQSSEASSLLRNYASNMEHDETRYAWLDDKLASLHRLAKKHSVEIAKLDEVEQALRVELDGMTAPEHALDKLQQEVDALGEVYDSQAQKLSRLRKRVAKKLAATVTDSMQTLAMEGGVFEIAVVSEKTLRHRHGHDAIVFNVSPNPGIKPGPLNKVASGGELSRISLGIQLATMSTQPVATLIFDEVDAGVGGATAETVGRLLRQVGEQAQVLCVTHLPQVAAQAHQHLRVSKAVDGGKTTTQLDALNQTETRDEIARMLGGAKITKKTRQHAQEMLDSAEA